MKYLDTQAEIGVATLMKSGANTAANGQRMSGKTGEQARLGGTSIIIPTDQAGLGKPKSMSWAQLCMGEPIAMIHLLRSQKWLAVSRFHLHLRLCQGELCAYRKCFAQSFIIVQFMHDRFAALLPRGNDGLCKRV